MRTLKAMRIQEIMLCLAVMAMAVIAATPQAVAGGADGYKITVTNPTEVKVRVAVGKQSNPFSGSWTDAVDIPPNGSHTFSTGAICPNGFDGDFLSPATGDWLDLQPFHCLGYDCPVGAFSACCWDLDVKICRKTDTNLEGNRDKDYGFCKN